jgi:hypothetical protein
MPFGENNNLLITDSNLRKYNYQLGLDTLLVYTVNYKY